MPSDGGLYSCMAVSTSGNASRDVAIRSKNLCLSFKLRYQKYFFLSRVTFMHKVNRQILIVCFFYCLSVSLLLLLSSDSQHNPTDLTTSQSRPAQCQSSSPSKLCLLVEEHQLQALLCSGGKMHQNNGRRQLFQLQVKHQFQWLSILYIMTVLNK